MNPHNPSICLRGWVAAASLIALLSAERLVAQTTTCSAPSSPGVNICSPADGSIAGLRRLANDQLATSVVISAAGTNTSGTAGMDVWLDGIKLGFFANTSNVDIENLSVSEGPHQLDIYAVGVDGELKAQTSFFRVEEGCDTPIPPGVNICSPADGSSAALPFAIFVDGANTNGTSGMDVWLDGVKLGFFANAATVNLNATAAAGPHQLDIFAIGVDGEVNHQSSTFVVLAPDCRTPTSPDVNICSPGNGFTEASPIDIVALGRNSGPTAGMDVWLDGSKLGFFEGNTVAMTNVEAGSGPHQLDIYAIGTNSETKLQSSSFTVVPCAFPASGVHTCSPANPSFSLPVELEPGAGSAIVLPGWVASPFNISAAGRNINGTAGMDVWLDGVKLDFFANIPTVNIENVNASQGSHHLDVYAVGVDGELAHESTVFSACPIPSSPGVNICHPVTGSTPEFVIEITATGRNSGPTAGMDVWLSGSKVGFFPGNFVSLTLLPSGFGSQPVPADLDIFAVGVDGELQSSSVVFTFNPGPVSR